MQIHFEFDSINMVVRQYLEEKMQNTCREFRASLHKDYCEFDDPIEDCANPLDTITHEY